MRTKPRALVGATCSSHSTKVPGRWPAARTRAPRPRCGLRAAQTAGSLSMVIWRMVDADVNLVHGAGFECGRELPILSCSAYFTTRPPARRSGQVRRLWWRVSILQPVPGLPGFGQTDACANLAGPQAFDMSGTDNERRDTWSSDIFLPPWKRIANERVRLTRLHHQLPEISHARCER